MIAGIGIDTVKISRMEKWACDPALLERFFHPKEIELVKGRGKEMLQSLAARFAAKEAFGKALGTGLAGIVLKDVMILNRQNEKPELILLESAQEALKACGAKRAHVSLSHDGDSAIALVILEV